jgi:hypothetical protein
MKYAGFRAGTRRRAFLGMIFSENRFTPRIKCGAGFFRIMPWGADSGMS